MKSGTKIVLVLIIIVIIGFIIHAHNARPVAVAPSSPVTTTEPAATTYTCTEGTFTASYSDTGAIVHLPNGKTVSLMHVTAASGVRYEGSNMTLITKGDSAYLQEGTTTTYSNCIVNTEQSAGSNTATFIDSSHTFSFTHSTNLSVTGGEIGYTSQWRNNTQTLGLALAQVTLPQSVQPKTNFGEAKFTVGTSSDAQAIKDCLVATNGEVAKGDFTINGIVYKKFALGDAGAGNYYDTTSYRTIRNSQCYVVEYTIHSTNIGNYSPDQGIKQFDSQSITAQLETMVQSFKFL